MSIRSSRDQLSRAHNDLMLAWHRTRDTWRDERARQFEDRVLEPLAKNVQHAARAMERMAANMSRAHRECGPIE